MCEFYSILLLFLLQISRISSAGDTPETDTSKKDEIINLPLVVATLGDIVLKPTKLKTPLWIEEGKIFSGGTTFAGTLEEKIHYICAKEDLNKKPEIHNKEDYNEDDRYCAYPTSFQESDALHCTYEPEPLAEEVDYTKKLPCVANNEHSKMYWFGYELCFTKNSINNEELANPEFSGSQDNPILFKRRFIVYRFCYDENARETLYTKHEITSPDLLNDVRLQRERQKTYEIMTNGYGSFESHYEAIKQAYKKSDKSIDELQQLAPADDLALSLWRKPTYHLLNMKPMKKNLKNLWDYINELIRLEVIKHNYLKQQFYMSYTRTFTTPENQQNTTPQKKLQQPDIWLRLIDHRGLIRNTPRLIHEAVVILLNNNAGNQSADNYFKDSCEENLCEGAFSAKFPETAEFVRCCPISDKIKMLFDPSIVINSTLKVDFLFKTLDDDSKKEKVED